MRRVALLLLLFAIPSAFALEPIFPGESKLQLEVSDSGSIRTRSTHSYDQWERSFSMDLEWSRVAVFDLGRIDGVEAFSGTGEEYSEAFGTISIRLNDQGVDSSFDCSLDHNTTRPSAAGMFVIDGTLAIQSGRGLLDDDAWTCAYGGNEVVHGGAEDVPLSSFSFAAGEGLEAGTFPPELAVALGFADDEEEWAAKHEKDRFVSELFEMGYIEAEHQLGSQEIPVARTFDIEAPAAGAYLACGDAAVIDTPSTSASCGVDGTVKVKLSRLSGLGGASAPPAAAPAGSSSTTGSASANATPSAKDATADAPGAPLGLVLMGLAACALAWRGRA